MSVFALNVAESLCGKRWLWRSVDPRLAQAISQRQGLSELAGRLLAPRAGSLEGGADYLEPKLRHLMPNPSMFLGMDQAAARSAEAVVAGEKIALFGDYDVDGATSTAQLLRLLRSVGCEPRVHIPDRLMEGYGPNIPALEALAADGVRLVIFLDCGTTAFAPLEAAQRLGLDVIVLDHHTAEPVLPPALSLVNPNRLDQEPGFGQLAACGVTFLFCVALNRALKAAGRAPQIDLLGLLDLVALGTVCDVVPLTGLNRAFVQQGLKVMANRQNSGLAALADVAGVKDKLSSYHLGFLLGPRINAGGRLGDSSLGVRLLSSDDPAYCWPIAQQLNELNAERKAVEDEVLENALAAAEGQSDPLVLVAGDGWHPGVIGIVASRLVERTGRPACVVGWEEDGTTGKSSGRSVAGVDLGGAVIAARQADLLLAGGGHAMAAGFTVERDKLGALHAFLNERLAEPISQAKKEASLTLEGAISTDGANAALADMVEQLGPYGPGNAEPRFVVQNAPIAFADTVGESHVRARLGGGQGKLKAIAFRARDTALGEALLSAQGRTLHLAGRLRRDRWTGGDAVELHVEDAAWPAGG